MSMESAKAFMERMKTDEDFAKKIMAETTVEFLFYLDIFD